MNTSKLQQTTLNSRKSSIANKNRLSSKSVENVPLKPIVFVMDLIDAAKSNDSYRVNIILTRSCSKVNDSDKGGRTALHEASQRGHFEIVKMLLRFTALNVNAQDHIGNTALHEACRNGHKNIVEMLLRRGARPSVRNRYGTEPIHDAAVSVVQEHTIVQLLLNKGINKNSLDNDSRTPLHILCKQQHNIECAQLLLIEGANANIQDKKKQTPLYLACKYNNYAMVELLLNHGALIKIANKDGLTPFELCCRQGYEGLLRMMAKSRKIPDQVYEKALIEACRSKKQVGGVMEVLLQSHPKLYLPQEKGKSRLHTLLKNNNEIKQKLLKYVHDLLQTVMMEVLERRIGGDMVNYIVAYYNL